MPAETLLPNGFTKSRPAVSFELAYDRESWPESTQRPVLDDAGIAGGSLAGRQGFEPRSDGPEPPVLPLDDLPTGPGLYSRKTPAEIQDLSAMLKGQHRGAEGAEKSVLDADLRG